MDHFSKPRNMGQDAIAAEQQRFMVRVYNWMGAGLALTGGMSWYVSTNETILNILVTNPMLFMILFIIEIGLVFYLAARVMKMSESQAMGVFFLYASLNGVTLAPLFLLYTTASLTSTFLVTAGMFGAMSFYGYTTKKDLTSWGGFLFMGLIGIIIASVVNMFMNSSALYWIISYAGILIFVGLTAYDTQKIKEMNIRRTSLFIFDRSDSVIDRIHGLGGEEKKSVIRPICGRLSFIPAGQPWGRGTTPQENQTPDMGPCVFDDSAGPATLGISMAGFEADRSGYYRGTRRVQQYAGSGHQTQPPGAGQTQGGGPVTHVEGRPGRSGRVCRNQFFALSVDSRLPGGGNVFKRVGYRLDPSAGNGTRPCHRDFHPGIQHDRKKIEGHYSYHRRRGPRRHSCEGPSTCATRRSEDFCDRYRPGRRGART